jgi:predicted nucleotidyltransferase
MEKSVGEYEKLCVNIIFMYYFGSAVMGSFRLLKK